MMMENYDELVKTNHKPNWPFALPSYRIKSFKLKFIQIEISITHQCKRKNRDENLKKFRSIYWLHTSNW